MYTIQVLLSTYNGEEYICRQLDSIMNQRDVDVKLMIRDDGSTDRTPSILREYASTHDNVKFVLGKNHGVTASFFRLFELAESDADYYATADQDDVWDEDKLITACEMLAVADEALPALYCCDSLVTDNSLKPIAKPTKKELIPDFGNALIENIARGGSIVFNRALLGSIRIPMPSGVYMHDWWLYLVASCFGTVIYDSETHYKYRQHSKNVLGAASNSLISRMRRRLRQSRSNRGHILAQAEAFNRTYTLPEDKKKLLDIIICYRHSMSHRMKGLSGKYLHRQSRADNIIFRLMFLTNHI